MNPRSEYFIYYVTNTSFYRAKSANTFQTLSMCNEFSKKGLKVVLLYPYFRKISKKNITDIENFFNQKILFSLKNIISIDLNIIHNLNKKIWFLIKLNSYLFGLFFFFLTKRNFVVYCRDIRSLQVLLFFKKIPYYNSTIYFESHFYPRNNLKSIRKCDKLIVINENLKKEYSKIYHKKILVAQDGVNLLEFKNLREKKINSKKLKIVYTGSFFIWKGTDFLIKCAMIDKQNEYILVGGSQDDIQRLKNSIELTKTTNIKLFSKTNRIELQKYIKMADILVLPNLDTEKNKWTSPIKLFEYMASKRIIMASKISAFDRVLNQDNCIFFKPNSTNDFIRKLKNINELNKSKIISTAYKDVKKFTWENRAIRIKNYISTDI